MIGFFARHLPPNGAGHSIPVIDATTSELAFAYAAGKSGARNQTQSAAEACAKHRKEFEERREYRNWLERNKGTDRITGSSSSDFRAISPVQRCCVGRAWVTWKIVARYEVEPWLATNAI
jgi:hypothetical protein